SNPQPNSSNPQPNIPPLPANWANNLKKTTDKSLKKVANPTFSPEGIPRIKIPDSVFKKGADLHQDFILGIFLGKTPSFSQIQSVLTHIWGKGMKLETHLRPESRSMLVRIPNSALRKKIVEQEFWHVGNVLFYVAQWSDSVAMKPPAFTTMPLWAHFKGIPFDLYTQEGLGRVGDLLGHPMEVDEFTRRMTNINVAHIKCKVDVTKPLPKFGEIERDNGEVVTVSIDYPWVPPICTCCGELGHLQSHCPSGTWKSKQPPNFAVHSTPQQNEERNSSSPPAPLAPPILAAIPTLPREDIQQDGLPTGQKSLEPPQTVLTSLPVAVDTLMVDQFTATMNLEPDGSIISPPSSPTCSPSHPSSPFPTNLLDPQAISLPSPDTSFVHFNPDNHLLHPRKITHLLALPAVHHPRP
ncbi:unnamed protein product, partial [Brassica rapa subsp. narinosa]